MRPGDVSAGAGQLHEALKQLRIRWNESAAHWSDGKRREFGTTWVDPIEPAVEESLVRINRLAQAITQAWHECS